MEERGMKNRGGRPALLKPEHGAVLSEIAQQQPRSSLDELTREFNRRSGMDVCSATVRKALKKAGITRMKPVRQASAPIAAPGGKPLRTGYTDMHRREAGANGMDTDLTAAEWALVADLFERQGGRGAPAKHPRLAIVNACCYIVRTNCSWRQLPPSFPPWRAVYKAFTHWAQTDTFERMHDRLRQQWRERIGRQPEPSVAIIDSQSTRSTPQGGNTGFDAGKKVKGRKRHLVVDSLGLLIAVTVTAASVQDRDGAAPVVANALGKAPTIAALYADSAYGGRCAELIEKTHGIPVHIVRHPGNRSTGTWQTAQQPLWPEVVPKGFVVQSMRWMVERTHAWIERSKRLTMHHDRSDWAHLAWVWLTTGRMLASRLVQ